MANLTGLPKLKEMAIRVVRVLGNGAGSTVLLISDEAAGGKQYALKVVKRQSAEDDIYIAQAKVEYEVSHRLSHESIVQIYDLRVKRTWFRVSGVELLMEFIDGKTLDEVEAPAMGQLILIFGQVVSALAHMHRRGVYHGDLKPSNIMVTNIGRVKLIDFGTAWIRGQEKNRVQGTPQYMAPEQASERVVDERTDIYNLGATMYRMFTGRYAQQGILKADEAGFRRLVPPAEILPSLPAKLNETILACLATSPDRRPTIDKIKKRLVGVAKSLQLDTKDLRGIVEGSD
jgi:serine/threonine-protein kinase